MILENLHDHLRDWRQAVTFSHNNQPSSLKVTSLKGLQCSGSKLMPVPRLWEAAPSVWLFLAPPHPRLDPHLDAPFEHVAWGEGSLPEQLTEDDDLLKEEHTPLLGP